MAEITLNVPENGNGESVTYLLWSNNRRMWVKSRFLGFTNTMHKAGRFDFLQAMRTVINSAWSGDPTLAFSLVVAPESFPYPIGLTEDGTNV